MLTITSSPVPFLLEIRDLWPQSLIDVAGVSKSHPFVALLGWVERFLYRHADAVISLLPGAADHILAIAGKKVEVVWVPNGVDSSTVGLPTEAPDDREFTVIYAGAHGPANGLDVVLEAAAILERRRQSHGLTIRLIGDGSEKERLRDRANELGLTSVRFEDSIPKAEIYTRLTQAHAFLMLLKDSPVFRWGVSPNKLFDYMATGRPVIFGVSTPHDPVALSRAGISIPPGNANELAAAILRLKNATREERGAMGARGRSYVLENHEFSRLATRVESMCHKAIMEARTHRCISFLSYNGAKIKRWLDLVLSAILLVIVSPIMLLVALAIRLTMGPPVLFRQMRSGVGGHPFAILKFRTMQNSTHSTWDPENDGERITALGRHLRRWSLDELPQLFNVLSGQMSLVGPRPLPIEYNSRYTPEQARRLETRPGITGWAQVNGRNATDWRSRFLMDTWYVQHRSLMLDLRILWRTAAQVVRGRGISAAGAATMTEFMGPCPTNPDPLVEAGDVVG